MTLARYLLGILLLGIVVAPLCAGSRALRGRLLPAWSGPPALLAQVVLALAVVTVVAEALGAAGQFSIVPMVAGLGGAGAAAWYACRRRTDASEHRSRPPGADGVDPNRLGRGALVVALVATALVVADWSARTVAALHHGMETIDTLWYHLPIAARFVQDGSIASLHYVDAEPVVAFFPSNSALFHGLGILFLDTDLLSPLLNLGWLALALFAGWCIGRPFGVAPVTLTGVAMLLATPGLVATQPGGGYNDVVGVALLLASWALLVNGDRERASFELPALVVAGLAAGLAVGTKFTFLASVGVLTVAVIALAPRGQRIRRGAAWVLALGLVGGFWYVRNLVAVGNPLPELDVQLGPIELSSPGHVPTSTLGDYLFEPGSVTETVHPAVSRAYGPLWWSILALAVAGLVLAVATGARRLHRVLGLVGVVALVAYVFTPQWIGQGRGAAIFLVYNLRYAAPALVLGLVLLPLGPLVGGRRAWWLLGGFGVVLVVTQLDPTVWPIEVFEPRFGEPVRGADSVAGLVIGAITLAVGAILLTGRDRIDAWRSPLALVAAGIVVVIGGFGLQEFYLRGRYTDTSPIPRIYDWARNVHDERIGIAGGFVFLQYPLYGDDQSNYVAYVARRGTHGAVDDIRDCAAWRRAVNDGRYSHVVTGPAPFGGGRPFATWTGSDPAATLVIRERGAFSLFALDGPLDPDGCDRTREGRRRR